MYKYTKNNNGQQWIMSSKLKVFLHKQKQLHHTNSAGVGVNTAGINTEWLMQQVILKTYTVYTL